MDSVCCIDIINSHSMHVMKAHYSCYIAICIVLLVVLLASKTQSHSEQHMHQHEFEACIDSMPTDYICDSCYTVVMHDKHWFNGELYPNN